MQCKRCKKECLESELTNGFCKDCIQKYNIDPTKLNDIENPVAHYFKIASIIVLTLGIISGLIALTTNLGIFIALLCIMTYIVLAGFLRGFAEVLQLLEDIKNK